MNNAPHDSGPEIRFEDLPPEVHALWAKSGNPYGHGLLMHMLDVAAVAEALLTREPRSTRKWLARQLGVPVSAIPRLGGLIAGLHDFGKATPGFEKKWPAGCAPLASLGLVLRRSDEDRHDIATLALLKQALQGRFPAGLRNSIAEILGAHHGAFCPPHRTRQAQGLLGNSQWSQAREALLEAYWKALAPAAACREEPLPFPVAAWLAGLVSVADWIGSSESFCPKTGSEGFGRRAETLQGHLAKARELADQVLDEVIGWPREQTLLRQARPLDALVSEIVGKPVQARPLQIAGMELLEGISEPALMIVEAPMGEGKTELAFLAHLHLQELLGHRGMYVALPTQATGNAMFRRAVAFLESQRPEARLDIQLAHGGAAFNPDLGLLRRREDDSDPVASSAWFSQRRRPLLSPYGVGTLDQALLSILNVKHHFVRLFGLGNKVVVLDEVHAYDVYTSGLICALLRWLKALGASVILMSATLPRAKRDEMLTAWGAQLPPDVRDLCYPRVLIASESSARGRSFRARPQAPARLVSLPEDVQALALASRALVAEGGAGAVIVNTVKRAQELYSLLRDTLPADTQLLLFHARFPADERGHLEHQVLDLFGRDGKRPARALLIATQVVEQSLDVDFDFLISDLAPIDLLLQRLGRLHRHERTRPEAHAAPILRVAGLNPAAIPNLTSTGWNYVYEDEEILLRTWALLSHEQEIRLPDDIDRLTQAVYGRAELPKDLPQGTRELIEKAHNKAEGRRRNYAQMAQDNVVKDDAEKPYEAYVAFLDDEDDSQTGPCIAMTRLGSPSITVVPVYVDASGTWSLEPGGEPLSPEARPDHGLAERIWNRQVRLSRKPIPKTLSAQGCPAGWQQHPLLRGLHPLLLEAGEARFGNLAVRLDAELGVVYATKEG